jgi:hypothetical protein
MLPPELNAESARMLARRAPLTLVLGRQDEFARPELIATQKAKLDVLGVAYETIRFDGGHEIVPDTLCNLASGEKV